MSEENTLSAMVWHGQQARSLRASLSGHEAVTQVWPVPRGLSAEALAQRPGSQAQPLLLESESLSRTSPG